MKAIAAAKFKAQCLKLMDQVQETGEPLVVTKRGKVLVRITAEREAPRTSILGCMRGRGEICAPLDELFSTGAVWNAER